MMEGILSLMQMAKVSAALARHLLLALENSTTVASNQLYSAKLSYLKQLERNARGSSRMSGGGH